jgi:hypothetical protein
MRPQTRPFAIEIKNRRRSAQRATAAIPQARSPWSNPVPGDLPELVPHRDVTPTASSEHALREASRVFGGGAEVTEPEQEPGLAAAAVQPRAPIPRVLPDLVAAAREQERDQITALEARRPRRASSPKPRRNPGPLGKVRRASIVASEAAVPALPAVDDQPSPTSPPSRRGHAELRPSRIRGAGSKLPRGERWKERRLPRVCWDR